MRRIISLLAVMAIVAAMTAVPAFAVAPEPPPAVCGPGPVAANNQAEGCFFTGSAHGNFNSDFKADFGLSNAYMHNTTP